jgi:hypothetical protein
MGCEHCHGNIAAVIVLPAASVLYGRNDYGSAKAFGRTETPWRDAAQSPYFRQIAPPAASAS